MNFPNVYAKFIDLANNTESKEWFKNRREISSNFWQQFSQN